MILFRGLGFITIITLIGIVIIFQMLLGEEPFIVGLGYICGGIINFFYGQNLNREYKIRSTVSKAFLNKIDGDHSLFFIRMEYWGLISILLGIILLFPNNDIIIEKYIFGVITFIIIISVLAGIQYLIHKFRNNQNKQKTNDRTSSLEDDDKQLTRREKLLGNTAIKEPSSDTANKSEAIQGLKALRNHSDTHMESDHSKYKPQ
jgi:hypothetical protein